MSEDMWVTAFPGIQSIAFIVSAGRTKAIDTSWGKDVGPSIACAFSRWFALRI